MVDVHPGGTEQVPVSGRLRRVLEEYAKALAIPVHVHTPTNHFSPPRWGDGLHLHLFALPVRPRWLNIWPVTPITEIPAVFSWPLAAGRKEAFVPGSLFARGVLKQDQKGHAISGMLGENIYVLFDLLGQPEALAPIILRRTLDLCLGGMTEWLSLATGRLPHQVQVSLHRLSHRTTLITLDQSAARGAGETTNDGRYRLQELSRQMTLQTRLLRDCQERFRRLKNAEQSEEALVREFEGLLGIPEVRDVEIRGDRLCVFTDTVDTVVAGKRYRLGCFRVDIRFNGNVAIKNLTQPHGYYDHPHVWNAQPCLGNIGQNVMKLVSEFQWVAAAELLLEYLKTVNPKEWYTPIHNWEELPA